MAVKGDHSHPAVTPSFATNPFVVAAAAVRMGRRAGSGRQIGVIDLPTAAEPKRLFVPIGLRYQRRRRMRDLL